MPTARKPKKKIPKYPCRDLYSKILEARLDEPCLAELPFHPTRKWRFDYAFPAVKVAIEIDGGVFTGGRHSGGMGQKRDLEKLNAAAEMGWLVLHYLPRERTDGTTLRQIYNTISLRRKENATATTDSNGLEQLPRTTGEGEGQPSGGTQ